MPGTGKHGQLPGDSEVMDFGRECTTIMALNQHNSLLHSKYLSFYSHISIGLTYHQENTPFQKAEIQLPHNCTRGSEITAEEVAERV